MNVNLFIFAANPFIDSYQASDFLGKLIFAGLALLSIMGWAVLVHKAILIRRAKKNAIIFQEKFREQQKTYCEAPLAVDLTFLSRENEINPFFDLYMLLKKQAIGMLNKNKNARKHSRVGSLFPHDLDLLAASLQGEGAQQIKKMEKNLYLLSTVVSLAPFLGLLGTVWGILITFSSLQTQAAAGSQGVLEGLSLALTTTVLGLVDAIPALIGYNYLKNSMRDFRVDMEGFILMLLSAVEMEYRHTEPENQSVNEYAYADTDGNLKMNRDS
jgi:biopolymer transport protein TolQ